MKYPGVWRPIQYRQRCGERRAVLDAALCRAIDVCRARPDVARLLVFGSYARNDVSPWSDLDLLVVTDGDPKDTVKALYAAGMMGDVLAARADDIEERHRRTALGETIAAEAIEAYARPAS